ARTALKRSATRKMRQKDLGQKNRSLGDPIRGCPKRNFSAPHFSVFLRPVFVVQSVQVRLGGGRFGEVCTHRRTYVRRSPVKPCAALNLPRQWILLRWPSNSIGVLRHLNFGIL